MQYVLGPGIVALLMGGPAWRSSRKMRKENEVQHSDNLTVLTEVRDSVVRLEDKVDSVSAQVERHLGEHAGVEKAQAQLALVQRADKIANLGG